MPCDWRSVPVSSLYEFGSGLSKPRSAFGSGFPFLSFKDVFYNSAVPTVLRELVNSTANERAKCSVKRGDVFLTRTSETVDELGMSCVALADVAGATFNGFTKRLRPKERGVVAPEFARYYFRSPSFRESIYAMSVLSTRASLNNEMLSRLSIALPPYNEQREIGLSLGALDDRIDNLRATNATLEAIAQTLFKSWFVDFDPVHAKAEGREPEAMDAATAALFPSEFEESELGLIPKSWRVGTLTDLADLNASRWTTRKHPEIVKYIDLSGVTSNRIDGAAEYPFEAAPSRARHHLSDGDTVVGTVRPGNRAFAYIHSPEPNLTGSTGFAVLSPKLACYTSYVYLAVTGDESIGRLASLADGAAYPAVRPDVVAGTPCVIGADDVIQAFSAVTHPMLERIGEGRRTIATLTNLRDTLIPRLISGKLCLPKTTEAAEAALA